MPIQKQAKTNTTKLRNKLSSGCVYVCFGKPISPNGLMGTGSSTQMLWFGLACSKARLPMPKINMIQAHKYPVDPCLSSTNPN